MAKLNVPLLEQARDAILANPQNLNMTSFKERCGTACCIGGHIVLLSKPTEYGKMTASFVFEEACVLLGYSFCDDDFSKMRELFYVDKWPDEFRIPYLELCENGGVTDSYNTNAWRPRAGNEVAAARICADYINHFIAENGKEVV